MYFRTFSTLLFISITVPGNLYAKKDTVCLHDYYGSGGQQGILNDAADSVLTAGGNLSNAVFKLRPYGLFILTETITIPEEAIPEIDAPKPGNTQNTAPPMITWTASTPPNKTYTFDVPGNIIIKNIRLLYASISSAQVGSGLKVGDSSATNGGIGGYAEFDVCIFDYSQIPQSSSGAVEIYSTHFIGTDLSSGVYLNRLEAGMFLSQKNLFL